MYYSLGIFLLDLFSSYKYPVFVEFCAVLAGCYGPYYFVKNCHSIAFFGEKSSVTPLSVYTSLLFGYAGAFFIFYVFGGLMLSAMADLL